MVQIKREICPDNPDQRAYFSKAELTREITAGERGGGEVEDPILAAVLEFPGICMAIVKPYVIILIKSPVHEWAEIEPSVLRLMSSLNIGEGALESTAVIGDVKE